MTALALVLCAFHNVYAQQIVVRPNVESNWLGFGSDFDPQWYGDTKRIDWRIGGGSSGVVITNVVVPPWEPIPSPIGLLRSSRQYSVETFASVQNVYAESEVDGDFDRKGAVDLRVARYAQVLNLQDVLLDQANAISEINSNILHNSIMASGRVTSFAMMRPEVAGQAYVNAKGKSKLSATYQVTSPVRFSLAGTLGGRGSLDLSVSLMNGAGQSLYSFSPEIDDNSRSWTFDLFGVLTPDNYTIQIGGEAQQGAYVPNEFTGGVGDYTLFFNAAAVVSADFDRSGGIDRADLTNWRAGFGLGGNGDADADGDTDGADFLSWQHQLGSSSSAAVLAPEPAGIALASLGVICLRTRKKAILAPSAA